MRRDQAVDLLRAADPASEKTSEVDRFPSMTALLDRIDERSTDVQTQERPRTGHEGPRDQRPRWLIPALAGAAAVILAIAAGALVLAGGGDEPDVIEPTPTTTPTTVPEAVAPSPLEVMDLHSQAVATADWAALRALYADTAEFEVNSETGETFLERTALTDLVPQTPFDWDGDGVVDGFDGLIDDAGRVAAHGATTFVSCSPVDDATLSCSEVWEGHAFMTPDTKHNSWTVTIVDGLITTQILEIVQRQNPIDTDLTSQYNMWVTENRPELEAELFDDNITLTVRPDTIAVHRELIAEWLAERESATAGRSPLEVADLFSEFTESGDWVARSGLHAEEATWEVNGPDGEPLGPPIRLADDFRDPAFEEDWDGDGRFTYLDWRMWVGAQFYAGGTTTFLSCSQADASTAVCDDVREGFAFLNPARQAITYTFTVSDGLINNIRVDLGIGEDPTDPEAVASYEQWVNENYPELMDDLFFLDGSLEVTMDNVDTHRELVAEWVAGG